MWKEDEKEYADCVDKRNSSEGLHSLSLKMVSSLDVIQEEEKPLGGCGQEEVLWKMTQLILEAGLGIQEETIMLGSHRGTPSHFPWVH